MMFIALCHERADAAPYVIAINKSHIFGHPEEQSDNYEVE
jgi:hypothetical protein